MATKRNPTKRLPGTPIPKAPSALAHSPNIPTVQLHKATPAAIVKLVRPVVPVIGSRKPPGASARPPRSSARR
jgi:hypothetical protein